MEEKDSLVTYLILFDLECSQTKIQNKPLQRLSSAILGLFNCTFSL